MPPYDSGPMPTKIPGDLWHDIQLMKDRLVTFCANAQLAAHDDETRSGRPPDFDYYRWLEPIAKAIDDLRSIERYGPGTPNVIPFSKKS